MLPCPLLCPDPSLPALSLPARCKPTAPTPLAAQHGVDEEGNWSPWERGLTVEGGWPLFLPISLFAPHASAESSPFLRGASLGTLSTA